MQQESIEIVRRFIMALDQWDFETIDNLLTDNAVLEMPYAPEPVPKMISGRTNMVSFFQGLPAAWDSPNFHDIEIATVGGDPNRLLATYKADTIVKMNGRNYKNSFVGLFALNDGKVSYMGEYYNPIAAIVAMGGEVPLLNMPF